ncbi:MAG TPA: hypothetical protein VHY37_10560 [Tepidisphaeraceae bacterium]|jgi:hypothetical protein|nr:hypothetical protein [Tepidisphaeraceae bacterium]
MIVTLTKDSRIEWDGLRGWALVRRWGGKFALGGTPGTGRLAKGFERVDRFQSLPEAFTGALRLGLATPGEALDLLPANRLLRAMDAGPARKAIAAKAWDRAGRMRVTVCVGEVGELLAGIVAELTDQPSAGRGVA